jgi:hyperosmotically inducible protein
MRTLATNVTSTSSRRRVRTPHAAAMLAIALLVGAIGCAARQPVVERDDVAITTDVQARLAAESGASSPKIAVDTKAGVVRLTGSVATDTERNSAERIARATPGVREVDNSVVFGNVPARSDPAPH